MNYAKTPVNHYKQPSAGAAAKARLNSRSMQEQGNQDFSQIEIPQDEPAKIRDSGPRGTKVVWLGMVVNAMDEKHYVSQLQKLIKLVDHFDLDAGRIYRLGASENSEKITTLEKYVLGRGGSVKFVGYVPHEYNVTSSPAWILRTESGDVVLEGIMAPERYINGKGEFIAEAIGDVLTDAEEQVLKPGGDSF